MPGHERSGERITHPPESSVDYEVRRHHPEISTEHQPDRGREPVQMRRAAEQRSPHQGDVGEHGQPEPAGCPRAIPRRHQSHQDGTGTRGRWSCRPPPRRATGRQNGQRTAAPSGTWHRTRPGGRQRAADQGHHPNPAAAANNSPATVNNSPAAGRTLSWRRPGWASSPRMPAPPAPIRARRSARPRGRTRWTEAARAAMPRFCFWK